MSQRPIIRLLTDPPLAGATNMARDETLLERVGAGESPPTLRLYQWDRPTISLGYFQHFADYTNLAPPAGRLPLVRRQTGGGAILHDLELTYSLTLPTGDVRLEGGANRLYERAHDAITACLSALDIKITRCGTSDDSGAARGPFFCFERRHCYDLLVNNDKIAGSAQRRTKRAVLQHGSIILANRFPQQPSAFRDATAANADPDEVPATPARFAQRMAVVCATLAEHMAKVLNATMSESEWSADELTLANKLVPKYAGKEWTRRS